MNKIKLDLVVPIYNEGKKIIDLLNKFQENIKISFRVLLCYDEKTDNIFEYEDELKKFNFTIKLVKNPKKGPCLAIKEGLYCGQSECVIVYPADDFINYNIIESMSIHKINFSQTCFHNIIYLFKYSSKRCK